MKCPKCGSTQVTTYRHMNAKVWCLSCGFILRDEGNSQFNEVGMTLDEAKKIAGQEYRTGTPEKRAEVKRKMIAALESETDHLVMLRAIAIEQVKVLK